jgi:hypothetical protein
MTKKHKWVYVRDCRGRFAVDRDKKIYVQRGKVKHRLVCRYV